MKLKCSNIQVLLPVYYSLSDGLNCEMQSFNFKTAVENISLILFESVLRQQSFLGGVIIMDFRGVRYFKETNEN